MSEQIKSVNPPDEGADRFLSQLRGAFGADLLAGDDLLECQGLIAAGGCTLSERARAAVEIGKLKRNTSLPIYEPDRERIVFENVQAVNPGPLPGRDLVRIYERIIDVMRNIQKEEIVPHQKPAETETELESDVND